MVAGGGACRRPLALFLFVSVDNKVDGSKLQTAAAASQLLERRGLAVWIVFLPLSARGSKPRKGLCWARRAPLGQDKSNRGRS